MRSVVYPLALAFGVAAVGNILLGKWASALLFSLMLLFLLVVNRNAYEPRHYWQLPLAVTMLPSLTVLLKFYDQPAPSLFWSIAIPYLCFSVLHYRRALEIVSVLALIYTGAVFHSYDALMSVRYAVCLGIVTLLLYKMFSALDQHYQRALTLAVTDELTGLFNRRALNTKLAEYIQIKARYPDTDLTLVIVDLDHFKRINDQFGHTAGDETLSTFASVLKARIRKTDLVARYGGEEFALLLPNSSVSVAEVILNDCRTQLSRQPVVNREILKFSAGIASLREGETLEAWVSRCDNALYQAKADGRNCNRNADANSDSDTFAVGC